MYFPYARWLRRIRVNDFFHVEVLLAGGCPEGEMSKGEIFYARNVVVHELKRLRLACQCAQKYIYFNI